MSMSKDELMLEVPPAKKLPSLGVCFLLLIVIELVRIHELFCNYLRRSAKLRLELCMLLRVVDLFAALLLILDFVLKEDFP